jgi:hypothetical protein
MAMKLSNSIQALSSAGVRFVVAVFDAPRNTRYWAAAIPYPFHRLDRAGFARRTRTDMIMGQHLRV